MPAEETFGSDRGQPVAFEVKDWARIVTRIREGDAAAMEELYAIFARGIRYFLLRNLGTEELDDRVHDCFVIVTEAITNGELRDPARLMGYVRTVVKRHIASTIETAVSQRRTHADYEENLFTLADWKEDPEQAIMTRQREEIARKVMDTISRRDREILSRFYVEEQSQDRICQEMGLSYNQFRLLKSRAKTRFGALGRRVAMGMGRTFGKIDSK
ncbi:MAG TPA: sigma-70 family RNA polymerase sigma factor [Bryobacteraceae bacterium]|nr:sigma-70 family RNA polymerase sigma factor [Bryobacteraceae bacterium]